MSWTQHGAWIFTFILITLLTSTDNKAGVLFGEDDGGDQSLCHLAFDVIAKHCIIFILLYTHNFRNIILGFQIYALSKEFTTL